MENNKSFKSKWNSQDEVCPHCGQITKINRGLTKQNLLKLFKKPSIQDVIIFVMIVLILFGAWSYKVDIQSCQDTIKNPEVLCATYYQAISKGNFGTNISLDVDEFGNLIIINKTITWLEK